MYWIVLKEWGRRIYKIRELNRVADKRKRRGV